MKTVSLLTSALLVVLVFAGCSSSSSRQAGPYVKPGMIMLTADQAEARGIEVRGQKSPPPPAMPAEVQALDSSAVVTDPAITVYTLGRMVDPADRNVMHEGHVVYRRETAPQWKLQARPGQKIIVGPRVTDSNVTQQPVAQEVDSFIADQRRATLENRKAIEVLYKGMEALSAQQRQLLKLQAEALQKQSRKEQPEQPATEDKPEAKPATPPAPTCNSNS